MKKSFVTLRRHGLRARLLGLTPRPRMTTQLTYESSFQGYLWVTDRGRSRLIKH